MFLNGIRRHRGLERCFWTIVRWMATPYFGGFSNLLMAERDISAKAYQRICRVSRTWRRRRIQWCASVHTWMSSKHLASCTSTSKGRSTSSSARPGLSLEVVAHKVICGSFGYFLHVCKNGQWRVHRNAAQIPRFTKSLCVCYYTQSGWDRPQSHSSKPCGENS